MRVWFNRTFSSVFTAIGLIREADTDKRFHLIYSNPNPYATASRVAHEFHIEPTGLARDDYIAWCLEFCLRHEVDIFIPGKESTALAGAHARFAAQGTRVLSAAAETVLELMHDKARFYATVELPEAPPADFRPFENLAQFDAAHAELRPLHATLCVKPSQSVYGLGFGVLDEARSSAALLVEGAQYRIGLHDFRRGLGEMGSHRTMLLMQYLDGQEYSVDCVGDRGRLVCAVPRRKPMKPGPGQVIDLRQDVLDATARLAASYGLNGVFNVQFREGDGALRLLEINPRMSGGIGMACMAGPNLPYIALKGFADGFDSVDVPAARDGIRVAELPMPAVLE